VREACEELASDFACDFPLLPEEVELDFSSSRLARVPVDGLTGWADSYFPLSLPLRKLLSLGFLPDLDSTGGCDCWSIGIGIGRGEERLSGAGTAHRHREGGHKGDRSTVDRAHAHVELR
jgi:hypothetical protein